MEDRTKKLPPEVLAACFRFLDFEDLITASHVSRFWRESALAFPDLWAHISLYGSLWASSTLFHTAMSRVGQLPVHFEQRAQEAFSESMAQALTQHMHRFSTFKCTYSLKGVDTCSPAPLLHDFACHGQRFHIPSGFLGGTGSLRTLLLGEVVFPSTSPALSSVTTLRATFPEFYDGDPGFRHLFELCPRLESLDLNRLEGNIGDKIPAGPAPRTLRNVALHTWRDCNVVELYTAWALEAVPDVLLAMRVDTTFRVDLASVISRATALAVTLAGDDWDDDAPPRIVAQLPGELRRTYMGDGLAEVWEPAAMLAVMLYAPEVRTLTVPLVVLNAAAPLYRWPLLAHLSIVIYEARMFPPWPFIIHEGPPIFDWAALDCLRALPSVLETLELHVRVSSDVDEPTLDDALGLRERLTSLRDCVPCDVHVHGFSADVVREMSALDDEGSHAFFH